MQLNLRSCSTTVTFGNALWKLKLTGIATNTKATTIKAGLIRKYHLLPVCTSVFRFLSPLQPQVLMVLYERGILCKAIRTRNLRCRRRGKIDYRQCCTCSKVSLCCLMSRWSCAFYHRALTAPTPRFPSCSDLACPVLLNWHHCATVKQEMSCYFEIGKSSFTKADDFLRLNSVNCSNFDLWHRRGTIASNLTFTTKG